MVDSPRFVIPQEEFLVTNDGEAKGKTRSRIKGAFVMADVDWLRRAGQVGGKAALLTALAVAYASRTVRSNEVALEYYHFDQFGVPPSSGRRCLADLEKAKLLTIVRRGRGQRTVVRVLR